MRVTVTGIRGRNGLDALAADLAEALADSPDEVRKVLQKGALNIKNDARARVAGIAHAPRYPYTITYDTSTKGPRSEAEIGPDPDKEVGGGPHRTPGNLGAILEYGSVNNAPVPHLGPALDAERPRFERALSDLEVRLLEGRRR